MSLGALNVRDKQWRKRNNEARLTEDALWLRPLWSDTLKHPQSYVKDWLQFGHFTGTETQQARLTVSSKYDLITDIVILNNFYFPKLPEAVMQAWANRRAGIITLELTNTKSTGQSPPAVWDPRVFVRSWPRHQLVAFLSTCSLYIHPRITQCPLLFLQQTLPLSQHQPHPAHSSKAPFLNPKRHPLTLKTHLS